MACLIQKMNMNNFSKVLSGQMMSQYISKRSLYSLESIGIDNYIKARERTYENFASFSEKFKSKMNTFVQDGPTNMIFTEDLKNIIHICEKTDMELVEKMVSKFNSQNKDQRFGLFVMGPIVMRMYYYLNSPREAIRAFENSANAGFFDQIVTYHILLDLLFKNEMYDEMFRVFEYITNKQLQMNKYPRHPVVLIMGAYYKKNTKECFESACKLWTKVTDTGAHPMRKAVTFFAALALAHGAPHIAVEVLSTVRNQHYVTVRNIKAIALSQLGRVEDSIAILRSVIDMDVPLDSTNKNTFERETIEKMQYAVKERKDKELSREFENAVTALNQRNLIENKSLDCLLMQEMVIQPNQGNNPPSQFGGSRLHSSFQRGRKIMPLKSNEGLTERF